MQETWFRRLGFRGWVWGLGDRVRGLGWEVWSLEVIGTSAIGAIGFE